MVKYADGPTAEVSVEVAVPPEELWPLVSDIEVPARFSEEFVRAEWIDDGPALGATFRGFNTHPVVGEWDVVCTVTAFETGEVFEWGNGTPDVPSARWRFTVAPNDGGSTLSFRAVMGPGPSGLTPAIERMPDREEDIVAGRIAEWTANMQRTVDGIKALAESDGAGS